MLHHAGELGHEVVVVAPGPRDEDRTVGTGGRIVRYRAPRMPYDPSYHAPLAFGRMRALIAEHRPDVLQVSSPFVPMWVASSVKAPLVAYVHHADPIGCYLAPLSAKTALGKPLEAAGWAYLRAVSARADATIVAGSWLERELTRKGCARVHTVRFGIDREHFGPERRDEAFRRELLGPLADRPDAKVVLIAGRLAADKRQRLVIDALELVAKERPIALVLLGDGPERERLEERGRRLPHFRAFRFTRDREEYARLLATVDALGHGSLCETFGFLLAECLASGTPLAAPDRGGAADLASPGFAETYPAFGGPEAAARAIATVLDRPREELSRLARAKAETIPTNREHYAALFAKYAELLGNQPPL